MICFLSLNNLSLLSCSGPKAGDTPSATVAPNIVQNRCCPVRQTVRCSALASATTSQSSHESLDISEDIIWHWKSNAVLRCLLNYIVPASAESLRNPLCHLRTIRNLN